MKSRGRTGVGLAAVTTVVACLPILGRGASAATALIPASKDNTLYEESGNLSNGAGPHVYTGKTNTRGKRRAVIAFDVAAHVSAGSTITHAKLTLNHSNDHPAVVTVSLHRLLSNWGEGSSNAGDPGGQGAFAQPGDATWTHAFYPDTLWSVSGGVFTTRISASTQVGLRGPYSWESTPDMVADVQSWLDDPATNNGWILIGNETIGQTATRFESKESFFEAGRPVLRLEFEPLLEVTLTASPSVGIGTLSTNLSAAASGSARGPLNYTFWWNCDDPRTSVTDVMEVCGSIPTPVSGSCSMNENGYKCDGVDDNPLMVSHEYLSPGVFVAKVIAERGGAFSAQDKQTLTVQVPCTSPDDCNDDEACTDDSCVDGGCVHTNTTALCNDGNACTIGDRCSNGACAPVSPLNCDDDNVCTTDGCDPATGCYHVGTDARPCEDGNACTVGDTCDGGTCRPGTSAPNCDDGNLCTDDSCSVPTGCVHTNNTAPCSDGNACTTGDTCEGATCRPGTPIPNCAAFVDLIAPQDGTQFFPDSDPPSFVWTKGGHALFRVAWSSTESASARVTSGIWRDADNYLPSRNVWVRILKLGLSSGTISWRVSVKDGRTVSSSPSFHILLAPAQAATISTPAPGASFSASAPPPSFSWISNSNSGFRIVFSAFEDLRAPKVVLGGPYSNHTTTFTPTAKQWKGIYTAIAKRSQGGTVYFAVGARDAVGRTTGSLVRSFTLSP